MRRKRRREVRNKERRKTRRGRKLISKGRMRGGKIGSGVGCER